MRHLQIYRFISDVARWGSIRKSADHLHITPSALTRRIQDFEEELGTAIFERQPQGMRLTEAGELLLNHIRDQHADFELLRSQIAELSGIRRGHIAVACAQAFLSSVLADEMATFRDQYPQITFGVKVRDNVRGIQALIDYEADLALLIDPRPSADMQELLIKQQPLCAVMSSSHPLAQQENVSLAACCDYPLALPDPALAIRVRLNESSVQRALENAKVIESDSLAFLLSVITRHPRTITFLPLSAIPGTDPAICAKPISPLDLKPLRIVLGKRMGRTLSPAAESFAAQLGQHLTDLSCLP